MRFSFISALFLLFITLALGGVIRPDSFQARSDGVDITLQWTTEDESGVARFEIEREAEGDAGFQTIASVDARGPSLYQYVDRTVFRKSATMYYYRVKIVYSNGSLPVYTASIPVSHTVSGVRRTWGSIKSMFR